MENYNKILDDGAKVQKEHYDEKTKTWTFHFNRDTLKEKTAETEPDLLIINASSNTHLIQSKYVPVELYNFMRYCLMTLCNTTYIRYFDNQEGKMVSSVVGYGWSRSSELGMCEWKEITNVTETKIDMSRKLFALNGCVESLYYDLVSLKHDGHSPPNTRNSDLRSNVEIGRPTSVYVYRSKGLTIQHPLIQEILHRPERYYR